MASGVSPTRRGIAYQANSKTYDWTSDFDEMILFGKDGYESKCGWSPFEGMTLFGKVENILLKGEKLMENGKILK